MSSPPNDPIGCVFDLDDTLAPDTTTQFLEAAGVVTSDFWRRVTARMHAGWDQVPAYLHELMASSAEASHPFTKDRLAQAGARVQYYPGVESMFDLLRDAASKLELTIEFYLVSSGIRSLIESLTIAGQFRDIWASDLVFDQTGLPIGIKNVLSFTDKTRPLVAISKGIDRSAELRDPFLVNEKMGGVRRIPFDRMVFVGDGLTDVPCFSMLHRHSGKTIAVYRSRSPRGRQRAEGFRRDERVDYIAPADFRQRSRAMTALLASVKQIAGRALPLS